APPWAALQGAVCVMFTSAVEAMPSPSASDCSRFGTPSPLQSPFGSGSPPLPPPCVSVLDGPMRGDLVSFVDEPYWVVRIRSWKRVRPVVLRRGGVTVAGVGTTRRG